MQNPHLSRVLLLALTLIFSTSASAWGHKAHLVIGMLAEPRLTPAARAAVNRILGGDDFATATDWADEMRNAQDHAEFWSRYASNWHYVNIDKGGTYATSRKNPRGDAYLAIQTFTAILLEKPVPEGPILDGLNFYFGSIVARPAAVKRFALKFLLHVVADLQQPLHSGYADDRGGNEITLDWLDEPANLHAIWDTRLLETQHRRAEEIARRLSERIGRTSASDIRTMESAAPQVWMQECQRLLDHIYTRHSTRNFAADAYATEFVPTVEAQLIKGGLRTAYVVNSMFGGGPVGSQ